MAHNTIAIVADCDDTLAPDTTVQFLTKCGVDAEELFTKDARKRVQEGWDGTLAYLYEILQRTRPGGSLAGLTKARIEEIGRELTFYPGVPDCFSRLKKEIEEEPDFRSVGIRVEFYVISSGIQELISASALADVVHSIWACSFDYDADGHLLFPKRVISFTDKTRYLYLIQKGKVGSEFDGQPYIVNEPMSHEERPIPFKNMIYLGDGPSDIPCMSLLQSKQGFVIGILSEGSPYKTWALGYGRRANVTVPADFEEGQHGYRQLKQAVVGKANEIRRELAGGAPVPGF